MSVIPVPSPSDLNTGAVGHLDLSPDGRLLAIYVTPRFPSQARHLSWVVQTATGHAISGPLTNCGIVFSPKGDVYTTYDDKTLQTFDTRTGRQVDDLSQRLKKPEEQAERYPTVVCFDGDGHLFVAMHEGSYVVVRNLSSGQETMQAPWDDRWQFPRLSARLALIEEPEKSPGFRIRDITTGQEFGKGGLVLGEAYCRYPTAATPDGRIIACINPNGIHVVELITGERRTLPNSQLWKDVGWKRMALSARGETIAVPLEESVTPWYFRLLARLGLKVTGTPVGHQGVKVLDTNNGEELIYFPEADCPVFSHDGKTLVLSNGRGEIEFWDLPVARPPRLSFLLLAGAVTVLTFAVIRWRSRRRNISQMALCSEIS